MTDGLLPTTQNRRNSLQSRSGFVSASVYEGHARRFGEMAYPGHEIEVYAVTVCVRSLVSDADQLGNIRQHNSELSDLKNTLANSLVFGHGAQIKGKVESWYLQPVSLMTPNPDKSISEDDSERSMSF